MERLFIARIKHPTIIGNNQLDTMQSFIGCVLEIMYWLDGTIVMDNCVIEIL
jgi:hypothetical protein